MVLLARVIGYDESRQLLNMSLAIPENSPLVMYQKGQVLRGFVDNLAEYGAFVTLALGYSGLIHKSNLGQRVSLVSEVLSVNDWVDVEVVEIKEDRGRLQISLRLVAVLK
jgi:small subunit ribosomal protein S1